MLLKHGVALAIFFVMLRSEVMKRKKHLGKEMLFVEVASGFEPLYEVLQTSA
jgi:hypothetical protein